MRRNFVLGCLVTLSCAAGLLIACVGDDPSTASSGNDAATDSTTPDGSSPTDSGAGDVVTTLPDGAVIGVAQVSAGELHACAVLTDGTVWCWGDNTSGEIGQPITNPGQAAPAQVNGISDVIQVSVGTAHSCALERNGSVWCWGRNNQLELGASYATDIATCSGGACNPVPQMLVGVTALQIAVGHNVACAIAPSGQISCWGANGYGQCGAAMATSTTPVVIPAIKGKRIQFGYFGITTCAMDTTNQVWCWGANDDGQLGHAPGTSGDLPGGGGQYNPAPHLITMNGDAGAIFGGVVDLAVSPSICAVRSGGQVWCWGRNANDVLEVPQADYSPHFMPAAVGGISGATNVSGGEAFCALVDGGALTCWGGDQVAENTDQYFDGGCVTFADAAAPCYGAAAISAPPFSQISVYAEVALAVGLDGGAYGWGRNSSYGRIGHPSGTGGDDSMQYNGTPTPVVGLP